MSKDAILKKVYKLYDIFHAGQIPTIANHEIHPDNPKGSRENYLYFTLPPCLNFQRSSTAMWQAAFATWNDSDTNYLFFPEKVVQVSFDKLQVDLAKHKLSLQKNKHTQIWQAICQSLHQNFNSDPREMIIKHNTSVKAIINYLKVNNKSFPYLNGPKMSNYWLYILDHYTDIKLADKHELSIIPDTHVAQCSEVLLITQPGATPEQIAVAWKELLSGSHLTPVEMHPVLWNWSRNNFLPKV